MFQTHPQRASHSSQARTPGSLTGLPPIATVFRSAATAGSVLLCLVVSQATSALTLDANFDHGSLESYSVAGNPASSTVSLVGRDNFYGGGRWRWLNFKVDDAINTKPVFSISDNFAGGGNALNNHEMVYSYDGQTWQFFDQNARSGGRFQFSNATPFTQDQVQVAYAIPYSYGMSVDHAAQVLASPWASPTDSAVIGRAGLQGIIGKSPGGVDDLGRTIDPRNIYAYRITNPATDSPAAAKRKVVITTGMHAGETLGTHTFQGLVDWLISDDSRAAALRDVAEFYAYPTLNPDGRFAGYNRSTVEFESRDPNGLWNPSLWVGHEDIQVNGEAMINDVNATPGGVDAFIDFHSTIPSFPGDDFGFIEFEQNDNQAGWWRILLDELQTNVLEVDSTGSNWTSANFAEAFLGAEVDVTFETQFGYDRNLDYYHQLGANFGVAFYRDFYTSTLPGDYDDSVSVDQGDLDLVLNNWGGSRGAWQNAEGFMSGIVDQEELDRVLNNWGSSAAPAFAGEIVPEPALAAVALGVLLAGLRRRGA